VLSTARLVRPGARRIFTQSKKTILIDTSVQCRVSAEATGAPDAFWYARPESGIASIKDTNGKTVAFSSPGSSTNLIIRQLVEQEKVTPKLVAAGGAPATLTQVMTGQIDVGWSVPPFVLQHLAEGRAQIIARGSDVAAIKDQTIRVNVANANASGLAILQSDSRILGAMYGAKFQ
jgi:ABC-type nitrate/sulfonate/bicarbonate transport system substrate-binding protein